MRKVPPSTEKNMKNRVTQYYKTDFGEMLHASIEDALLSAPLNRLKGACNLILTSPPFPLVRKKRYGNETGKAYLEWLRSLASGFAELLTEDGSIIIEIGNAWEPGMPVMSTLPLQALFAFKEASDLYLCQHIICHNPARLPGPAAWVNVQRLRLKDSYTHVWWLSKTPYPKSDNRKVLNPYSKDMQRLLKSQKYNAGVRPSGHVISETGFLTNHGGSIGPNVLDLSGTHYPEALLKFTGTKWDVEYRKFCKENDLPPHPARMQSALAAFFIQFLTDEGDLVLDPFGGSNTTGSVSEEMHRKWICVEANADYIEGSRGRFEFFRNKN